MKKIAIAVKETIFQVAVLHLLILAYKATTSGEWVYLNMGSILDLNFLIPAVEYTLKVGILLAIPTGLLILVNYVRAGRTTS